MDVLDALLSEETDEAGVMLELLYGDNNYFDSIDGGTGAALAELFDHSGSRFRINFGAEEVGPQYIRLTISITLKGLPLSPVSYTGRVGRVYTTQWGPRIWFRSSGDEAQGITILPPA